MSYEASKTSWLRTAKNVRLEGGRYLKADLQRRDGSWNNGATFDLDRVIGNEDGLFLPNGVNFSETANSQKVDDRRPQVIQSYLIGNLQKRNGSWNDQAGLDLTNAFTNEDGQFNWTGQIG